jgi:murein DD-endopeptidase MepM/ murein hydrolase activator NlpD
MRIARLLLPLGLMVGCAPTESHSEPQGPRLSFPVACKIGETCEIQNYVDRDPGPGAKDYRCGPRTYEAHSGIDIRIHDMAAQRAGVDVLAAAPGKVTRLRDGVTDISVKAAGAPSATGAECGNGVVIDHGDGWETQYCHVAKGSLKVKAGDTVVTGQPIARVGLSGNTEYPHLHITVRHGGAVVDPFAPTAAAGSCNVAATSAQGLWDAVTSKAMSYKSGAVLNAGFSSGAITPDALEAGTIPAAGGASPALVAYVRAIDLEQGDEQLLVLKDPSGAVLAQSKLPPLAGSKAQYLMYVGKPRPAAGWTSGLYSASYTVLRAGKAAVSRSFQIKL